MITNIGHTLHVVHVFGLDGEHAFDLLMYGNGYGRPEPGRIRGAMRTVGLDPDDWVCSPFAITRVR